MSLFKPCLGKNACRDDGATCLTCGRSLEEIKRTQDLVAGLTDLATEFGYENHAEFAEYVARRIVKKIEHQREASAP